MIRFPLPLIGLCAYSGTGKTTLLKKLIPLLTSRNLRVGVVKHAHHQFDIDHPGKDSYTLRQAGALQIAVASRHRIAWIRERKDNTLEPALADALATLQVDELDLVIAEGFKRESFPKIELHRPSLGKPLLHPHDRSIIALATDADIATSMPLRRLDLNNIDQIADFIVSFVNDYHDKAPDHAA